MTALTSARRGGPELERADQVIGQVRSLAALPQSVKRILDLTSDPEVPVGKLREAISAEPAIAIQVLRMVNSSFFGVRREVTSLERAVLLLGQQTVRHLVMFTGILPRLNAASADPRLEPAAFYRHCQAVAIGASMLAGRTGTVSIGPGAVAGLLHDVGLLVEMQARPRELVAAIDRVQQEGTTLPEAELEAMGTSHEWVGEALCQRWRLPNALRQPVSLHHRPELTGDPLTLRVHVADVVADRCGLGYAGNVETRDVPEWVLRRLRLDEEVLTELEAELPRAMEEAELSLPA